MMPAKIGAIFDSKTWRQARLQIETKVYFKSEINELISYTCIPNVIHFLV